MQLFENPATLLKNSCLGQIPPCNLSQESRRREQSEPIILRIQTKLQYGEESYFKAGSNKGFKSFARRSLQQNE